MKLGVINLPEVVMQLCLSGNWTHDLMIANQTLCCYATSTSSFCRCCSSCCSSCMLYTGIEAMSTPVNGTWCQIEACSSWHLVTLLSGYEVTLQYVYSITPSSHYQQDKTVLSCRRCEQNSQKVKTVADRKFRNCFVQSRNAVRTAENSLDFCQFCSHHCWRTGSFFASWGAA